MAAESRVVGIRLDPEQRRRLDAQAERLQMPPSTLARQLVVAALADEPAQDILAAITALERELRTVREDVSSSRRELATLKKNVWNATLALLVRQKTLTPTEANQWAKEHLSR